MSKVFLSAYSLTQFCHGTNIRPGGEEEVKTMNEEPRKLMHWEDPCSIENDQNLFNLIRREIGGEVERPLCGYLGHGGHEEAVLLLLPHWQDLKPPSLSAEYRSLITAFSSFETVFDVVSCWIKLSLWTLVDRHYQCGLPLSKLILIALSNINIRSMKLSTSFSQDSLYLKIFWSHPFGGMKLNLFWLLCGS